MNDSEDVQLMMEFRDEYCWEWMTFLKRKRMYKRWKEYIKHY